MLYNIKNGNLITFDYESDEQDKTTYIVLVDSIEVDFNQFGNLWVNMYEYVNYVLDSLDEDLIGFIQYGQTTWLNNSSISNLHVSTQDEINKFKEALKEDGTFEAFFEE